MWQMGGIGPMMGQSNHFRNYAPDKIEYGINRYVNETKRLFGVADTRLGKSRFLAGDDYTIADIACYPVSSFLVDAGYDAAEFPALAAWQDRFRALPGFGTQLDLMPSDNWPPAR